MYNFPFYRESAPDEVQAHAAGMAEGYLTRTYIVEQYKEFYTNDVCKSTPDACQWIKERFRKNSDYVQSEIKARSSIVPFWHQVNLFYKQMEGVRQGYKLKSARLGLSDEGMDDELGIHMLTFIADFWDIIEQYKLLKGEGSIPEADSPPSRPSCSVLIKPVDNGKDVLFAHNTWHEYRAMGYRLLKIYRLNVHTLPDRKELVPGHTISMSSYAGNVIIVSLNFVPLSLLKAAALNLNTAGGICQGG